LEKRGKDFSFVDFLKREKKFLENFELKKQSEYFNLLSQAINSQITPNWGKQELQKNHLYLQKIKGFKTKFFPHLNFKNCFFHFCYSLQFFISPIPNCPIETL